MFCKLITAVVAFVFVSISKLSTCVLNAAYLIIILVHAGIISLKDKFLLEIHVTFILDVFGEPLFWAVEKVEDKRHAF